MTGILQFAVRQGAETESYMTSAERIADYAKLETEPSTLQESGCEGAVVRGNTQPSTPSRGIELTFTQPKPLRSGVIEVSLRFR